MSTETDFYDTVALHPTRAEELVTMQVPNGMPNTQSNLDDELEWRELAKFVNATTLSAHEPEIVTATLGITVSSAERNRSLNIRNFRIKWRLYSTLT